MALVFRATDMQLGREVAVKVLRGQFGSDEEFVRRFRREAQNAASLSHPNIVQTYDVGEEEETHYIVMELVTGKTLKALIQEQGPLPVVDAARIGMAIADALAHAHAQRIVHRDIKPHNILVGRDGRVKVADFGIARATTTDTVTHTGSIMGSAHYFSPEQANGQPTGEKSDLYSLGVVLYEMVTGCLPFQGESPITVALKHLRERVVPPSELNPEVPLEMDEIILQAMEKEPEDRYETAVAMRDALSGFLEKHLAGKTHMNSGDFPTMDLRATRMRRSKTKKERQEAERERRRRRRTVVLIVAALVIVLGGLGAVGWGIMRFLDVPEVDVPPIEGKHITEAEQLLAEAKLSRKIVAERHSDLELNYIIESRPEPGSRVKQGATIELVVSKGPEMVELIDVRGMDVDSAKAALLTKKFNVSAVKEVIANEPEGQVIGMAPAPKTPLKVGASVELTVSKGPLRVPSVVGLPLEEAQKALADAGLVPGTVEQRADAAVKGTVLAANPAPGTQVSQGQHINLVVSLGPEIVGATFAKPLTVPGSPAEKVRFQVILVDQLEGAEEPEERTLVDEEMAGGKSITVSDKFYGQAYLIVKIDGVERVRISLP